MDKQSKHHHFFKKNSGNYKIIEDKWLLIGFFLLTL